MGTATAGAVLLAAAVLYGPGLAVAWLLPAPARSPWELRVAVAPLLSVVVAVLGVQTLAAFGVGLRWPQLAVVTAGLWGGAWWWTRRREAGRGAPDGAARSWRAALEPVSLVVVGGLVWVASLAGFGLYLPNRDFKNHAVMVAQIASTGTLDPSVILQASPMSEPVVGSFYPLGLHALLAWGLPSPGASTVAVTAASAVVVCVVSLPLAVSSLARMWTDDARLPWLSGLCAACLPGATAAAFAIGSVVLMVGLALFAAGLVCLWLWLRAPTVGHTVLLALAGLGLFVLHVAEAVALLLVALGGPALRESRVRGLIGRRALRVLAGLAAAALLVLRGQLGPLRAVLATDWDVLPNDAGPGHALLAALIQQPAPLSLLALVWWGFALLGLVVARRRGWGGLVGWALAVPVLLAVLATVAAPAWLTAVTAPWYGTHTRVMLLALPSLVVAGSAGALAAVDAAAGRALRVGLGTALAAVLLVTAASTVPERRADLAASLAGAGDTEAVADRLSAQLAAGGTVLNLEADGTPLLFAYARVPVLSALTQDEVDVAVDAIPLAQRLLQLDDPGVAARLAALDVRFLVLGTGSRYWGQGVGYDWRAVAAQPQLSLVERGSDVAVLRYQGGAR